MLLIKITSPAGQGLPRRRRVPVGVRQDQPRDAAPDHPRLARRDHRRRHRVDAPRRGRPPLGDQPRGRLLRRRARHRRVDQPDRGRRPCGATRSSRTSRSAPTATSGGRASPTRPPPSSPTGRATPGRPTPVARPPTRTRASPSPPRSARRSPTTGTPTTACRSTRSSSADAGPRTCRSSARRALEARRVHGRDHLVRADRRRRGHRRRAAPRPVRDAAVLRLQHGRLLGPLGQDRAAAALRHERPADLPGELVPQGRGRLASSGRASARTRACSSGSSAASRAAPTRSRAPIGRLPGIRVARPRRARDHGCRRSSSSSTSTATRGSPSADLTEEFFAQFGDRVPAAAAGRALEPALPPPAPARMTR